MKKLLIAIVCLLLFNVNLLGQTPVPITTYSIAITQATCPANGSITIKFPYPGSAGYESGWTAALTSPNQQEKTATVPTDGSDVIFSNLDAGNYALRLTNGFTTLTYNQNPIVITSSYVSMTIAASSTAPSCPVTIVNRPNDATATISVTAGGLGPFEYKLSSPSLGTITQQSANRSYTFTGLAGNETVNFSVTDLGCTATINRPNYTLAENNDAGIIPNSAAPINCIRSTCDNNILYVNFDAASFPGNRLTTVRQPGNAVIRINGTDYPLSYLQNNLTFNSGGVVRFVFDPSTISGAPPLVNGLAFSIRINWGCNIEVFNYTYKMSDAYLVLSTSYPYVQCDFKNRLTIGASPLYDLNWLQNVAYTIEREDPIGTFTTVATGNIPTPTSNTQAALLLSQSTFVDLAQTGTYKVTLNDGCRTTSKSITFQTRTSNYPISEPNAGTSVGILQGTGSIFVDTWTSRNLTFPMTVKIERVDNQNNWILNPTQPLNLAGSYSISFPITRTYNSFANSSNFILYDLPYGQYRVTITDFCSATNNLNKVIPVTIPVISPVYNPQFSYTTNCLTNDISFKLNINNASTWRPRTVILRRRNDDGSLGSTVSSINTSGSDAQGTFTNVTTGNGKFRIIYDQVGLGFGGYSVAQDVSTPTAFYQDIDIPAYQNIDITINSEFCSPADFSSGIVNAEVSSGTLNYPLTMALYAASNGAATTLLQGPIQITSPSKGTIFQGLSAGEYVIRTTSACYNFDKPFTLNRASSAPTARVSEGVVCPGSPATIAVISATNNLYDIDWYVKNTNTLVGSGMPVTLTPSNTTTYTARFKLKSGFNCPTSNTYESDVLVKRTENPNLTLPMVNDIELCKSSSATITISNTEADFTYEFLTPTGQSYNPQIIGNGNGGDLTLTIPSSVVSTFVGGNKHSINVTNSNAGCSGKLLDQVNIIQSTPLTNLSVSGGFVCSGSAGTITIQNSEIGINYSVLRNGSPLSPSITGVGNGSNLVLNIPASNLVQASTSFTVEASGSRCQTGLLTQTATITVQQPPTVSAITHASCGTATGSVTLTTAGGSGNYEYSRDNSTWTSNPVFSGIAPGSYIFYSRDQNNNGCNTNGTIQVLNNCFEITKTPSTTTYNTAGQVITYTITVRNTGTTTLTNIAISDPQANLSTTVPSLAPTFSTQVSASYTITQTDINSGSFTNTARAFSANVDKQASATINAVQTRAISFTKTASTLIYTQTGQQITYTFTVQNIGNVPLSNVSILDPLPGLSAISPASVITLAPGTTTTFTATYNITAQDMLNTTVQNTATASGTFNNVTVDRQASVTISNTFPLPATGLELTARWINNNNDAELSWSTLTEQNTDYFLIERSTDGRNFNVIGNPVKAAGNSNSKRTYLDYDRNLKGIANVFYRLRLFDIDKSSRYSNTAILRSLNPGRFNIYPNPASNLFTIEFNQAGTYDVQLYTYEGQLIKRLKDLNIPAGNKVYSLDRGSLPNGTYIVRVIQKQTDEVFTSKIVFIQ